MGYAVVLYLDALFAMLVILVIPFLRERGGAVGRKTRARRAAVGHWVRARRHADLS